MDCDYPLQVRLQKPKTMILANGQIIEEDTVHVPCGRCLNCINTRIRSWVFRLEQELAISESSAFVTLTYRDEHLPKTESGLPTLDKDDLTRFFKRLRHHNKKVIGQDDLRRGVKGGGLITKPIKYYAVGEYGEQDKRPHYHIILFNCGSIETLYEAWEMGLIHSGTVTSASMAYVAGYINQPDKKPIKGSEQVKNFSVMSKGLGASYMTEDIRNNLRDHNNYVINSHGQKLALPRYYKEAKKLPYKFDELDKLALRHKANDARKENEAILRKKYGKDYDKLIASGKFVRALKQKLSSKTNKI